MDRQVGHDGPTHGKPTTVKSLKETLTTEKTMVATKYVREFGSKFLP
jgi:hypothetical protein